MYECSFYVYIVVPPFPLESQGPWRPYDIIIESSPLLQALYLALVTLPGISHITGQVKKYE